ncbi:MAG TPA: RdgB/HAM1 family non-canonical purine NTP pyrophosphatase [Methylocella sp.]|nr:RdgB/HAM1 family non-canonical purine NTP pyrophosphatase [Methylocella sp.]
MKAKLQGQIVIATHNEGKLAEMRDLLAPYGIKTLSSGELGLPEPEETGETFAANAILKARAAAQLSRLPAFADDSGLCIDALNGEPGIHSARYARDAGGFDQAMQKLEEALAAGPHKPPFKAHFGCALALAFPDGKAKAFEGRVFGELVFPPRGHLGFGYDPIFRPEGFDQTFGEMTREEKHSIPADGSPGLSHRARAFQLFAKSCLDGRTSN